MNTAENQAKQRIVIAEIKAAQRIAQYELRHKAKRAREAEIAGTLTEHEEAEPFLKEVTFGILVTQTPWHSKPTKLRCNGIRKLV